MPRRLAVTTKHLLAGAPRAPNWKQATLWGSAPCHD